MDVPGPVKQEESRASERVVSPPGDLEDSNIVVPGLELDEDLHVLRGDPVILGLGS